MLGCRGVRSSVLLAGLAITLVTVFAVAGCGDEPTSSNAGGLSATSVTTVAGGGGSTPTVDPADFSTTIDNLYFPVPRGHTFVYDASGPDGATGMRIRVLLDTQVVMGVECRPVLTEVFVGDDLRESTQRYYAQDAEGNVWYFGEDVKKYEGGEVTSTAGSWQAGVDGAAPGIVMKADPTVGDVYPLEYLAGKAGEMAEVLDADVSVEVPYSSFTHVVKIKDWTPAEARVVEEKYYAPGMGLVLTKQVEGGSGSERLIDLYGL
jgi:hypothetical protein